MYKPFFVVDTNCFVSANLIKNSSSAKAFDTILKYGRIALSNEVFTEYTEVLYRKKLDKYLTDYQREMALSLIRKNAIFFNLVEHVNECRDPKDNKFLELALASNAVCILTGDADLLVLNPFRKIEILEPSKFLLDFKNLSK